MNPQTEENIKFFNEYSKNFPAVRDVQSRKLSDQERFIKSQRPKITGNFLDKDSSSPKDLDFDWSKFSIAYLKVEIYDAESHLDKERHFSRGLLITGDFFHNLFKKDKKKPTFEASGDFFTYNPHPPDSSDVVHIHGSIQPVLLLEESDKILYTLDVVVFAKGFLHTKRKNSESNNVIVAVIQKHFISDKEGLIFHKEAKEALHEALSQIKSGFMKTSWKTVVFDEGA